MIAYPKDQSFGFDLTWIIACCCWVGCLIRLGNISEIQFPLIESIRLYSCPVCRESNLRIEVVGVHFYETSHFRLSPFKLS